MQNEIATGYHTCIDYELVWDYNIFRDFIIQHGISKSDIKLNLTVTSMKELLINSLYYMIEGTGGEIIPTNPDLCDEFAERFNYEITIGGTAARASIAISKLGYPNSVFMCCNNKYFQERLPEIISCKSINENTDKVYPHVILQYPKGLQFSANDISFETRRPNRVMISNDLYSTNMKIPSIDSTELGKNKVFLSSCFSQVLDSDVLTQALSDSKENMTKLPATSWVVLEDGHYVMSDFKTKVHQELKSHVDILSMNEEELQELYGKRIDILNAVEVTDALKNVYSLTEFPNILVHSKSWAVVYGKDSKIIKAALKFGIAMASSRFKYGDDFGNAEFEEIVNHEYEVESSDFCEKMESSLVGKIACVPSFNLDYVKNPTVVGLGDFFAGGLLIGLLNTKKNSITGDTNVR